MDAIERFAAHVVGTDFADLPAEAVEAARTFILDSLGVGIVGSAGPWTGNLAALQETWGQAPQARVWVTGQALPAPAAAMCNAYQIHNSEFDCIHEAAVVHATTVVLPCLLAVAERDGGLAGRDLMTAVVLGVDVACHVSLAARTGMRFFRPATAGALAAVAGLGKARGFDQATLVNAFSIAYGQICGTMQAHAEGSGLLAMQMGFNARNAVVACDMAAAGFDAPKNVLEGPFGYLRLIEAEYDLEPVWPELGRTWRIAEMAHKPFPSGRATHGVVDACLSLMREHGFSAEQVEAVVARVPPLVHRLVGRRPAVGMTSNHARLCGAYVAACALLGGTVGVDDFDAAALRDPRRLLLADRIDLQIDDNPDPNALVPVTVDLSLRDGARHELRLEAVYGSPAKPLDREAHLAKFRSNCAAASRPLSEHAQMSMIDCIDGLEGVADVRTLVDAAIA